MKVQAQGFLDLLFDEAPHLEHFSPILFTDRKFTPKNLCDKEFAEFSGELSGAICLKIFVLMGSALELFRDSLALFVRFFGFGNSLLALDL